MFDIQIVNNNDKLYIHIAANFIKREVEKLIAVNCLSIGEAGRIIVQKRHQ